MKHISTIADHELILLIAAGSIEAFRQLFDKYRNKIFSMACKFTGSDDVAEDAVQEVFIKLWLNKEKLLKVDNFNAYLNTVVRNHIFNYLRKIALEQKFLLKLAARKKQKNKDTFDSVSYNELQSLIYKAVSELPVQQKKVYNLSRVDGLKHEEIAEKMGISRHTVKGHLVAALNHIRNFLLANGELAPILILIEFFY
jgi:RNA polymerase sigma-70 factor (ECF subfamily)